MASGGTKNANANERKRSSSKYKIRMLAALDLIFFSSLFTVGVRATITIKPKNNVTKISLILNKNNNTPKNKVEKMIIDGEMVTTVFLRVKRFSIKQLSC